MRKLMTKEVTKTVVKIGQTKLVDGEPSVEKMEDEILLGNVSLEKAQRFVNKKHGVGVSVFGVEVNTDVYEMPVEDFIKYATIKVETEETEEI